MREQLREREATHAEEIRRKDHLLAGFLERLPELPSGQEAGELRQDVPGAATEMTATAGPFVAGPPAWRRTPEADRPPTHRRPWWRRLLGLP